ncbi:MAG: hypothetical protein FJ191_13695 [Gammaproteobacteria bacterium]|nr:hypothetical protein [Gammaproteobacteria bacterium]
MDAEMTTVRNAFNAYRVTVAESEWNNAPRTVRWLAFVDGWNCKGPAAIAMLPPADAQAHTAGKNARIAYEAARGQRAA